MNLEGLRDAIEAVAAATAGRQSAVRSAWDALKEVDPLLATEINSLWPNEDVAANWVCSPLNSGLSPAELVMAGRSELVRGFIRKAEYGLYG